MTGLSEKGAYKIASNINKHIRIKLKRLENIKIKNKNEIIINHKNNNQVDDLY
jgi:hypothetical protein